MTRARHAGFSLIEVVVAFAILSIALAAIYRIFAVAAHQAHRVEDHGSALLLAEAKLTEAERALASANASGETAEGFRWQRRVEPYAGFNAERAPQPGLVPYQITVEVQWQRGGSSHVISLDTVRLGRGL